MLVPLFLAALLQTGGPDPAAEAGGPDGPPAAVLAEAGGEAITRGRVALFLTLSRRPRQTWPDAWGATVDRLRDRALMRRYLKTRRAVPESSIVNSAVRALEQRLGDDPAAVAAKLQTLSVTADDLRAEAELPKAWEVHARRLITPARLRDYFEEHRPRYDGTALTVAHVFKPGDATAELAALKGRIDAGELTFAEAARQHSQSPTAADGGVIGPVRAGDGRVPPEVSAAVFSLEPGGVAGPVRSRFGTHLVTVTGVAEPGELVLEDVRATVRRDLKRELWDEIVAGLR